MNFFDNYYTVGSKIRSTPARQEYFTAVVEYYYTGQEPKFKHDAAEIGFAGVRFSLDKSRRQSSNRRKTKPKPNANQTRTKTKPNANQNGKETETVCEWSREEEERRGRVTSNEVTRKPLNPFDETETDDEGAAFAAQALEAFNEITGKQELYLSPEAFMHLRRIQDSGRTIDDVRAVIAAKHAEWQDDDKMRRFIRPKTLFGGNFESYLSDALQQVKEDKEYEQYD